MKRQSQPRPLAHADKTASEQAGAGTHIQNIQAGAALLAQPRWQPAGEGMIKAEELVDAVQFAERRDALGRRTAGRVKIFCLRGTLAKKHALE